MYQRINWTNQKPLSVTNLNKMDKGISDIDEAVDILDSDKVPKTTKIAGLPLDGDILVNQLRHSIGAKRIDITSELPEESTSYVTGDLCFCSKRLYYYDSSQTTNHKWVLTGIRVFEGTATPSEANAKTGDIYVNLINGDLYIYSDTKPTGEKWLKINGGGSSVNIDTGLNHTSSDDYVLSEKVVVNNFVNKTTTVAGKPLSNNITSSELRTALGLKRQYEGSGLPEEDTSIYQTGDTYFRTSIGDFYVFNNSNPVGQKWVKINGGTSINIDTGLNHIDSDDYVLSEKAVLENFEKYTITTSTELPTTSTQGYMGEVRYYLIHGKIFKCLRKEGTSFIWKELVTADKLSNYIPLITREGGVAANHLVVTNADGTLAYSTISPTTILNKQDKTDSDLLTINKSIVPAINEVNSLAKEKQSSKSFVNYSALITYLQNLGGTALNIGQSLYVKTLNVPDLWIYENQVDPKATYVYESDEKFLSDLRQTGTLQIGFYKVAELETQKVDLSDYVETNKIKSAYSTSQGAVYDVTYINSLISRIEQLEEIVNNQSS